VEYFAMRRILKMILLGSVFLSVPVIRAQSSDRCATMTIVSTDVDHFWRAWDLWQGRDGGDPSKLAGDLQVEYLDRGSAGLRTFTPGRIQSAAHLAETVLKDPAWYQENRADETTMEAEAPKLRDICRAMLAIYPKATMPAVYLEVGARNSGGTSSETGLVIGVEMYSRRSGALLRPDDFLALAAHELVHFQQRPNPHDEGQITLLRQAMVEGAADFIAECLAGHNGDETVKAYADAHEQELWERFQREMGGRKLDGWLYNRGRLPEGTPPDLGYYEGYKICQAFYERGKDKAAALEQIVAMDDEQAILNGSAYGERFR
jgi:uncharacterized protein YjaZ